jgi:hypothetical protein
MQVNLAPTLANMGPIDSSAVELLFKNIIMSILATVENKLYGVVLHSHTE